ncbi:MAG: hypothetical protein ACTS22_04955 [Phycisphaerales bacterium]
MRPRPVIRERGGIYVVVLSISAVTMSIGLIGLSALAAQREMGEQTIAAAEAAALAESGVQLALERIDQNPDWRDAVSGLLVADTPLGRGTLRAWVEDPDDGNLTDDDTDTVRIIGQGRVGAARQRLSVDLSFGVVPIEALSFPFVIAGGAKDDGGGNGDLSVDTGLIIVNGGKGRLLSISMVYSAPSMNWIDQPDPSLVALYAAMGTAIPASASDGGTGEKYSSLDLSVSKAPSGVIPDPEGVYVIDAGGADVTIDQGSIVGTLVVHNAAGATVTLTQLSALRVGDEGYPVVVTDGNLVLENMKATTVTGTRPDADDNGFEDDAFDGIRGLIYADGDISFVNAVDIHGVVIATGTASIRDTVRIRYDDRYKDDPPPGFGTAARPHLVAGSWREIVD